MKRILVVDDSELQRMCLAMSIRNRGYETFEASDGQVALDLLTGTSVDAIVTDCEMPRVDGYALIAALHERGCSVPILFQSCLPIDKSKVVYRGKVEYHNKLKSDLHGTVTKVLSLIEEPER